MKEFISIVMTTYNHSKYIMESIESVLNQTYKNIELIIVNNSSSDDTIQKILKFDDPRVKLINERNFGPSFAVNIGVKMAQGNYISIISSDDNYLPEKLEYQLDYAKVNDIELLFGLPTIIDEESNQLQDKDFPVFFDLSFINNEDLYRKLFFKSNFLCASTAFFNKCVFERVGNFKISLLQLQDFDFWIRSCDKVNIGISNKRVVNYRVRSEQTNLSSSINNPRTAFENNRIYDSFFYGSSGKFILKAFPEFIQNSDKNSFEFNAGISKLYLSHFDTNIQTLGLHKIANLIDDEEKFIKIIKEYNFDLSEFFQIESYFGKFMKYEQ